MRKREGGAYGRMTSHWKLSMRREDSYPDIGVARLCRKNEGGLGEGHFHGDGLHQVRVEPCSVYENRQLVSTKRRICEYIEMKVSKLSQFPTAALVVIYHAYGPKPDLNRRSSLAGLRSQCSFE